MFFPIRFLLSNAFHYCIDFWGYLKLLSYKLTDK